MKIGNYTIPKMRLFPKLYDWIKLIYESYRLEEADNANAAAMLCGHKSANSGAWLYKLADMRMYGLMEKRAIKLTPLAERLTYKTEQEKQEATNEAILNIPLWKELYSRFGVKLPDSNFWVQLQGITGLDPLEAQKHANSVRKAYLDDIKHISTVKQVISGDDGMGGSGIDASMSTINIQAGPFTQTIPLTKEGIEYAKGFLDLLGKQIGTNQETPSEEEPKNEEG